MKSNRNERVLAACQPVQAVTLGTRSCETRPSRTAMLK